MKTVYQLERRVTGLSWQVVVFEHINERAAPLPASCWTGAHCKDLAGCNKGFGCIRQLEEIANEPGEVAPL